MSALFLRLVESSLAGGAGVFSPRPFAGDNKENHRESHLFLSKFFVETVQDERFAGNIREVFQDFELAFGACFPDVDFLNGVMFLLHRGFAAGAFKTTGPR